MEVRTATVEDIPSLCMMAQLMWEESPTYSPLEFDQEHVARYIGGLNVAFLLIDHNGDTVGMMGGFIAPAITWNARILHEAGLYIIPECRGGSGAIRLIKALGEWGKANGAVRMRAGTTTGVAAESTKRLYEVAGFAHIGYLFDKEL